MESSSTEGYIAMNEITTATAFTMAAKGITGVERNGFKESATQKLLRVARNSGNSHTNPGVRGTYKDKFEQGWLGGVGSEAQFQGVNGSQVGIVGSKPYNDNISARSRSTLKPFWSRSHAFAPGSGLDALYSGITWTSEANGNDPITGITAPILHAKRDRISAEPNPQGRTFGGGGQNVTTTAPVVLRALTGVCDKKAAALKKKEANK